EFYNKVNDDLRKFSSDNYYNQLLLDESLTENILSVYINHVEEREYVYELYKNGKPFKSSNPTTNRYFEFLLDEPAKYRIRVNLTNEEVNPRFSQTYEFEPDNTLSGFKSDPRYIEIPSSGNRWMLNAILQKHEFQGLIGNAYLYPNGYSYHKVFLPEEINEHYIKKEDLFNSALNIISNMTEEEFKYFKTNNEDLLREKPLMFEFLNYLQMKFQ